MSVVKTSREAFKPQKAAEMQAGDEELKSKLGSGNNGQNPGFHKLEKGNNYFRLFPAVPLDDVDDARAKNFTQPKVVCRLPIEVDEYDKETNKKTGNKIVREKDVFNARIHGDSPIDLVEEYRKLVENQAKGLFSDKEKQKAYLLPLYGKYVPNNPVMSLPGLFYKESYICYALKISGETMVPGRLELKKSIKNRLNEIAIAEAEEDALGYEPFTDLEEGKAIKIISNPDALQPQDYYKTELYLPKVEGKKNEFKVFRISDEHFEWLINAKPLYHLYNKCFKRSDFLLQVEGIERFDKKHKFNVFESDEFQNLLDQQNDFWPEDTATETETETTETKTDKTPALKSTISTRPKAQMPEEEDDSIMPWDNKPNEPALDISVLQDDDEELPQGLKEDAPAPVQTETKLSSAEALKQKIAALKAQKVG